MKKQTFIVGALILTIGGFVAKIIGAFYKIPLTNILGSVGMGIYYLVFPLYNLMLVFSSSGVGIAVTKLVARSRANKLKRNETTYLKAGLVLSIISSLIFSSIMFIFAKAFAYQQGNVLSYLGFLAISPAIIFASLVTVLKAYFQGVENMIPSSIAMIVEQIIKMIVGLVLSFKLLPYGIEFAVMGSILAVTFSEAITFIIMLINFYFHKTKGDRKFYKKDKNNRLVELKINPKIATSIKYIKNTKFYKKRKKYYIYSCEKLINFKTALKETFSILIPNTLMSLVIPTIGLIDSFMIINLLTKSGYSSFTATSLYGINNGVVSALISLPVIITSSLATAVVPNLSGLSDMYSKEKISQRITFFIKITWLIILPIFIYFFVMSDDIILALYNFKDNGVINEFAFASKLLMLSSVSIIYNALLSTLISILQALNKSYKAFFILLIGMILRTILAFILLQNPSTNIFGVVIANVVFLFFCVCGCIHCLKKSVVISISIPKFIISPILITFISGILTYYLSQLLVGINVWLRLIMCGLNIVATYSLLLFVFKCFDKRELKYFSFLGLK